MHLVLGVSVILMAALHPSNWPISKASRDMARSIATPRLTVFRGICGVVWAGISADQRDRHGGFQQQDQVSGHQCRG
jgi:hypothetical protein